jgi:hypothetical protein
MPLFVNKNYVRCFEQEASNTEQREKRSRARACAGVCVFESVCLSVRRFRL